MRSSSLLLVASCLLGASTAHGNHGGKDEGQKPIVSPDADWMTRHMAEEHHAGNFDATSFFTLHDFDGDGHLEPQELLRTYGLMDESNRHVTEERKAEITRELLRLMDVDGDGSVSSQEWADFVTGGGKLPDFGTGPGHHGDDEYEYEIHHWEKYHDENTKLEDLTHPEDVAHFKKHEEMEEEQRRLDEMMASHDVVYSNIPRKFRRHT